MSYVVTDAERKFLEQYDIRRFEQPSVTVDIAVFALLEDGEGQHRQDYRRDPELSLAVLMVRRGSFPYKDCWALPGGFVKPGESMEDAAARELQEETSVQHAFLVPFGNFSETGRDPRGWIISNGFLALIDAADYTVHAGTDAWDAKWFRIRVKEEERKRQVEGTQARIVIRYALALENTAEGIRLSGRIEETRSFAMHHEKKVFRLLDSDGFAFDHAQILMEAFLRLRQETENPGRIVFDLMPEKFTLNMLQDTFEAILGKPLLTPNFRRKLLPYLEETDEKVLGTGHRPARLYRRNLEAFYT